MFLSRRCRVMPGPEKKRQEKKDHFSGGVIGVPLSLSLSLSPSFALPPPPLSLSLSLKFSMFQWRCKSTKAPERASLVAQWLRVRLPMQGTQVRALVQEDATEQVSPCATTTEPARLEPVLRNKRSHHNEKPTHRDEE